jgi:hypothetical protein
VAGQPQTVIRDRNASHKKFALTKSAGLCY